MIKALREQVVVQPGGRVEVRSSDLRPGTRAEVIIIPEETEAAPKHSLRSLIGAARGAFATPEEADAFIRAERNAWD